MRNLGDQWIELIDGVEHMLKAAEEITILLGEEKKEDV